MRVWMCVDVPTMLLECAFAKLVVISEACKRDGVLKEMVT